MSEIGAALERLRGMVEVLRYVLPGPEVLKVTHAEESAAELVDAFDEYDRLLGDAPEVGARWVDEHTTAVTIAGVDVYVCSVEDHVIVSVGTEDLPGDKTASIQSVNGVSWEYELP
jgi:hypothetical protein